MSRIAVLSDIHGNLEALIEVIAELDRFKPEIWICLGDIVGYGPNPSECIEIVRERNMITVLGNHDAGVCGKLSLRHFRNPNRKLIELTKALLSNTQINWLNNLKYIEEGNDWVATHASPVNPSNWNYIESAFTARNILNSLEKRLCFIGHTHKHALVSNNFGINKFNRNGKFLINPGSVGQSRDGDYRASCVFIDTESETYLNLRVDFNIEETVTKLEKLGFTYSESNRLMKV